MTIDSFNAPTGTSAASGSRRGSRRRLLAAVAAVSLLAAACGSDDDADQATDAAEDTAASADDAPAEDTEEEMAEDDAAAEDEMAEEEMAEEEMAEEEAGVAFGPACELVPVDGDGSFSGMADDPAATAASNNPLLSTLVTAVTAADLVDTLNSEGPFTILAPTDDAFAAVDPATLETILADPELLTTVLTYHVIPGESLTAEDLAGGTFASVEGEELTFGAEGTSVNEIDVVCSDVTVANGTVHIIDQVLVPAQAVEALSAEG